jgi:hypothetical protein
MRPKRKVSLGAPTPMIMIMGIAMTMDMASIIIMRMASPRLISARD